MIMAVAAAMLLRDRILVRATTLKMLHDVGIGLSYVMYDVGRTAAHAIHATRLSNTQAHLCVRLPAVPSPCHVPGEAVPWRNVKWKMYSQSNLPCPLGAQTRVLIASLCALNLRSLQSLRIKTHNVCTTRASSCMAHAKARSES